MELNEERINEIVEEVLSEMASLSAERDAEEQLRNFCDRVLLRRFGAAAVRGALSKMAKEYNGPRYRNPLGLDL